MKAAAWRIGLVTGVCLLAACSWPDAPIWDPPVAQAPTVVSTPAQTPEPSVMPAAAFDEMMRRYAENGTNDVIRLGPGTYLTAGERAWTLSPQDSLVGAGIGRTIIRRVDPTARSVIDGWVEAGHLPGGRIADLTVDANATRWTTQAACGILCYRWTGCRVERVEVIGLGSFKPNSESFGILLSHSTNSVVDGCWVDRNVGGYVTAFTVSGRACTITNCTATLLWQPGWDKRLAGLAVAGGGAGSQNLRLLNNTVNGARFGVFCDTGPAITGLDISGNRGTLRSDRVWHAIPINLTGKVKYLNVRTNANQFEVR